MLYLKYLFYILTKYTFKIPFENIEAERYDHLVLCSYPLYRSSGGSQISIKCWFLKRLIFIHHFETDFASYSWFIAKYVLKKYPMLKKKKKSINVVLHLGATFEGNGCGHSIFLNWPLQPSIASLDACQDAVTDGGRHICAKVDDNLMLFVF